MSITTSHKLYRSHRSKTPFEGGTLWNEISVLLTKETVKCFIKLKSRHRLRINYRFFNLKSKLLMLSLRTMYFASELEPIPLIEWCHHQNFFCSLAQPTCHFEVICIHIYIYVDVNLFFLLATPQNPPFAWNQALLFQNSVFPECIICYCVHCEKAFIYSSYQTLSL